MLGDHLTKGSSFLSHFLCFDALTLHNLINRSMGDLQARIGPKVTKLYPNLTWIRPGAVVPQSPSKDTPKPSQTQAHQSDEKDDASSNDHASSVFSSPNKPRYQRTSSPRPRKSSRELSLLSRMGMSSGGSQDDHHASEGKEAAGTQPSLLSRVRTTEDKTPQPSIPSSSVCLFFTFCNAFLSLLFASYPI